MKRMDREQFFARLAGLDDARLRKALWNLYWRGTDVIRERIEAEIDPDPAKPAKKSRAQTPDPELVLDEVMDFVALARSGSYMGGDRRVSPRERSRWRFTFQRLAADAQASLAAEDLHTAAAALEGLIDFACELRDFVYFHSEDPVEAARFVVSDAAQLLWTRLLEREGFPAFAGQAAPQLIRWEAAYGWTHGFGRVAGMETSLAAVIAGMLRTDDAWITFADRYLEALDETARRDRSLPKRSWGPAPRVREDRARNLSRWHQSMLDRFVDSEAEDRLDRLVAHPALDGPDLVFIRASLAQRRGQIEIARGMVSESLEKLPGHRGLLDLAMQIDAPLPARAREILRRDGR